MPEPADTQQEPAVCQLTPLNRHSMHSYLKSCYAQAVFHISTLWLAISNPRIICKQPARSHASGINQSAMRLDEPGTLAKGNGGSNYTVAFRHHETATKRRYGKQGRLHPVRMPSAFSTDVRQDNLFERDRLGSTSWLNTAISRHSGCKRHISNMQAECDNIKTFWL